MEQNNFQISIIIPVYNTEKYIQKCIESLYQQNLNIEIIFINDGSTDNSKEIINNYCKKDVRIKVMSQNNQGPAVARNHGLEIATGNYIAFLDSDDWIDTNCLGMLYNLAIEFDADMVMGNTLFYYNETKIVRRYSIPQNITNILFTGKECFIELMKTFSYVPMQSNYIYKRSFLIDSKMAFENICHEDELWTLSSMCLAKKIIINDLPFYYYRQRSGSIVNGGLTKDKRMNSLFYIADRLMSFSTKFNSDEDRECNSWIYVKINQMYYYACILLLKSSNIPLIDPTSFIKKLNYTCSFLYPSMPQKLCQYYFFKARLALNEYLTINGTYLDFESMRDYNENRPH